MNIDDFFQSKGFKIAIACIAVFVALFFVFSIGVYVGTEKANSSFKWAEQYHNNFAGPAVGFLQDLTNGSFVDSNGVFGEVMQIGDNTITVKGRNNNDTERIILLTSETTIKYQNQDIKISDLNVGDDVVIIGNSNESGQIEAMLIRVMPSRSTEQQNPQPQNQPVNSSDLQVN